MTATGPAWSGSPDSPSCSRWRAPTGLPTNRKRPLGTKVLRQFEALRLIVRADTAAVKLVWTRQHSFVDKPADDLAVFEDERHFARAHLEHGSRSEAARSGVAETRIEEARIVHAEFTDQGIERHHFCGVIGRHLHRFVRRQDIKFVGIKDEALVGACRDGLPKIGGIVSVTLVDFDHRGVAL